MLTVDCVVPRITNILVNDRAELLDDDIRALKIVPEMAFIDETYIDVLVTMQPVLNVTQLTCLMHDVKLPGLYV